MAIFKGAGVAIATPMKENLEINFDKLDEMLEEQIAGGTDAIIICGTTGESATMTEAEHAETIRFAVERVNHRIPVIAGTGSNCTRTAIELSKEAEKDGAEPSGADGASSEGRGRDEHAGGRGASAEIAGRVGMGVLQPGADDGGVAMPDPECAGIRPGRNSEPDRRASGGAAALRQHRGQQRRPADR